MIVEKREKERKVSERQREMRDRVMRERERGIDKVNKILFFFFFKILIFRIEIQCNSKGLFDWRGGKERR